MSALSLCDVRFQNRAIAAVMADLTAYRAYDAKITCTQSVLASRTAPYTEVVASALPAIASELGSDESTLRRAVMAGTVRASRPKPRALKMAPGELDYLRRHWTHLEALKSVLRTEPSVALAVLYGSMARGDDTPGSDFDVLVAFKDDRPARLARLGRRFTEALQTHTDVALLPSVRRRAPYLLLQALDEGRVLVDREGLWPRLQSERAAIARAARRSMKAEEQAAARGIAELLGDVS